MAKQTINIGSVANDGTGDPLRTAFDKINDNFDELYSDDLGDVGSIIAGTGISVDQATGNVTVTNSEPNATHTGDVTGATALTIAADAVDGSKIADDSIDSEHYVDGSIDTAHIANDAVSYDKIGTEFTTAAVISASDVDFSSAQVFTKTLSGNTTLTFSNVETGMVKDLVITGAYTLALPASVKTITGTYDGSVGNLIQIVSTNGATEQWATISQEA
tara:strand:+ start:16342 stop:16995 length:654 start_codon:yes stop_codon:yes gene_type:complete